MYVKHLTNFRGHKQGTIVWCGHGGVLDMLKRQGMVEELPDYDPDAKPPPEPVAESTPDGDTDTYTDEPAAEVVSGESGRGENSGPSEPRPARVRRRPKKADPDSTD